MIRKTIWALLPLLLSSEVAYADDFLACQQTGGITGCQDNVKLRSGKTIGEAYLPSGINATKIGGGIVDNTTFGYLSGITSNVQAQLNGKQAALSLPLSKANGGFGADVSTGQTNGFVAKIAGGALVIAALVNGDLPSGIDATKLGSGTVTNTILNYLANVTSDIQTQLNGKQSTLSLPLSKANGGFGVDVSTGLTNGYYAKVVGGAITIAAILAGDLPTGIDVAKLGTGVVTNTVFAYLANVSSDIQTQLNSKQNTLTLPLTEANGGFGADVSGIGTGCVARTGATTWVPRTMTASTGIVVTNGSCVAGNPTYAVDTTVVGTTNNTLTFTNKTYSSPIFSGTFTGSYSLGGTPSLGTNLTAGLNKIIGLAAGTTTGDSVRWEQAGVAGPTFYLNTGQAYVANGYVGIAGDGSSTVNVNVTPWVAPVAGTLRNMRVYGLANTSGSVAVTIYKASSAVSPSYASTTVTCTLTNTFQCSDTTHSVSVSAGELVVGFTGSAWSASGSSITTQFVPN